MPQAAQRNTTTPARLRKADALATCAIRIGDMRCVRCGASDVLAVAPGEAEDRCDLFLLRAETPMRAWCASCWHSSFAVAMAA